MVDLGQRVQTTVFKFTSLAEDMDELNTDPCKHTMVFVDGSEMHEVSHTLL